MEIFHERGALDEGRTALVCQQTRQSLRGSTSQIKAIPITGFFKTERIINTAAKLCHKRNYRMWLCRLSDKEIWSANNFVAKIVYSG